MHKFLRRTLVLSVLLAFAALSTASINKTLAPDFTLKSHTGENIKLSELRGQVVMINFWASWCGPCRQEMPLLDALYARYEPLGFTLLGVNVEEDPGKAKSMIDDLSLGFPILFDSENSVSKQYEVIAMPSTVIVDRDGKIRYIHHGYKPGDENKYQDIIRAVIRE